ncbi:MAG: methyltransferase domain-containing protein [Mariprofundaceae bacterium]|nr:methyltransferase domain-containing protein [Mariprofundaceae bacterium]
MSMQASVLDRYTEGAESRQEDLCCPVNYNPELLKLLPEEIIEKDYGCGDPSAYVRQGDTVLDLGSGGGKICYMAAQLVGDEGHVIGVDMNDDMLALARKHQAGMAKKIGGDRVSFHKGYIQDLALDLGATEKWLAGHTVKNSGDLTALKQFQHEQRHEHPLIADNSVDLVVSNCVLNLVDAVEKDQLIHEIFRVLKPGGRVAISDIVSDEEVPEHLQRDPELWSGCISGAFQEHAFIKVFLDAGFMGTAIDKWDEKPWQVVKGIEFRSVTLTATKPEDTECLDYGHAVIYKGPFSEVHDDDGHVYYRGERMAVCQHTYRFLTEGPFSEYFIGIEPANTSKPSKFCAPAGTRRPASMTKGGTHSGSSGEACCC